MIEDAGKAETHLATYIDDLRIIVLVGWIKVYPHPTQRKTEAQTNKPI
jgi:hypothetical protein